MRLTTNRVSRCLVVNLIRNITRYAGDIYRRFAGDPQIERAKRLARIILQELSRQGFTYERQPGRGKRRKTTIQRVRFRECLLTENELWCPLDLSNLPHGTTSFELKQPKLLESIADRCNIERRSIRTEYLPGNELCYVVNVGGNRFPNSYSFNTFSMPDDAPPLAIPLGISGDGKPEWVDLVDLIHLLIVGPTGKGKSTLLHSMLITLIDRNKPQDVQIWLADLKRSEFTIYEPLVKRRGIIARLEYDEPAVISMMSDAVGEMKRRQSIFQRVHAVDIGDYQRITNEHMHRIVIVVDEVLQIMQSKERVEAKTTIAQWAENLLILLASQGRSAGIHVCIATQIASSVVLTSRILANYESVICFGVRDWRQSQMAIGESMAEGLPRGRIILKHNQRYKEYQTCWFDPVNRRMAIHRIANHGPGCGLTDKNETKRFVRDAMLLLKLSNEQLDGRFSITKMWGLEAVRNAVPRARLEEISQRLERDGILVRGKNKNSPRMINSFLRGNENLLEQLYNRKNEQDDVLEEDQSSEFLSHSEDQNGIKEPSRIPEDRIRSVIDEIEQNLVELTGLSEVDETVDQPKR